jgi:uncharacterized membrane protein YfcA
VTTALLVAAVILAGLVRGFTGFGAGLVLAPSLGLLLGPEQAIPVLVLLDAVAGVQLLPSATRQADWRRTLRLGAAAAIGIPAGGMLLVSIDPVVVQRALSAIVLAFVAVLATGWRHSGVPGLPATLGVGLSSGLLTGLAGIGGPPVILLHLLGPDEAAASRSNLIAYFFLTQLVALATYAFHSLLTPAVLRHAALLAPAFLVSLYLGSRLFRRAPDVLYRRIALVILGAVALTGLLAA